MYNISTVLDIDQLYYQLMTTFDLYWIGSLF